MMCDRICWFPGRCDYLAAMLLCVPPYCRCHNDSGFRFPPSWLRVTTSGAVKTCGESRFLWLAPYTNEI